VNYLADTNLVSEFTKPKPNLQVLAWIGAHERELYVSSITIAEIRRGIERMPLGHKRGAVELWFDRFCKRMENRTISFNASIAHIWGQLAAKWERIGIGVPILDGLIAATAHRHNLTVVTRNVSDFQKTGLRVINPFDDSE